MGVRSFTSWLIGVLALAGGAFARFPDGTGNRHHPQTSKLTVLPPSWSIPLDGGLNASLPAPWANTTLKWITVTRGTWNFTCSDSSANGTVTSIGTEATLFDATPIIPDFSDDELGFHDWVHSLANVSLGDISLPIIGKVDFTADHTIRYDLPGLAYFEANQIPGGLINVPAAPLGPTGSAALGWVAGSAAPGGYGAELAYRVEAAGGKRPPSCLGYPFNVFVEYSAETWFYG